MSKARKSSKTSKPKPQDDVIGWAIHVIFGSGKKASKAKGKRKGPKFSEDAVGWLIAQLVGK